MRHKMSSWKGITLCSILCFLPGTALLGNEVFHDSLPESPVHSEYSNVCSESSHNGSGCSFVCWGHSKGKNFIHRLGIEARPSYVIPTNPFLEGENERWKPIQSSIAAHLKYSFQFRPNTCADHIYGGAYQGLGVAYYSFGDKKQLGDPITFYLFQGARIARITPKLSLNYEWNFGLSTGWQPYDNNYNFYNGAVGSRMNAYINAGIYFNWTLSRYFDLTIGGDFTHFSNGNTKFPNAGINTTGAKIGLVYNFNREEADLTQSLSKPSIARFPRHISYDLVLFGSWRRKGVYLGEDRQIASPGVYPVAGFNFAPMYNVSYKFRTGVSLDGVYDGSANVYTKDVIVEYGGSASPRRFYKPGIHQQLALGVSGRFEYVMPYFTIGIGLGTNVLGRGDLRGLYQMLALKIAITRSSFLHIGYNLQDFQTPNYLMLGLGFRFHNKYPKVRH
ncbi:acyloxyacyl hydrolase [Bacteroides faecalis]|uniref:Lipid A 3-O-deacylase n=1 Tax=Bacteroides faecalis TaxID=2447885 RepID=A0A401M0B5_9BACE|nr:acyloxyacyl hydrolase [Bacteroides faecalis]GCB37114.1 hypothetical protein KGMB02408_40590 [Bacteroides faecalis]